MSSFVLKCDNILLPTPAREGLSITPNHIWSQNAGRNTNTGHFIGDIIAVKHTVLITYETLSREEMQVIWRLISSSVPFHTLEYPLPGGGSRRARGYFADTETLLRQFDKRVLSNQHIYGALTLEFVEC